MPKRFLDNPTYEAGLIQSRAFRALNVFMNEHLAITGLTLGEWKLIGHLNEVETMKPTEIAELLAVKQPIATRLLKGLEKKGYAVRKINAKDNRYIDVSITKKGRALVAKTEKSIRAEMKHFLADVNLKDLEVYGKVLNQLAGKLK